MEGFDGFQSVRVRPHPSMLSPNNVELGAACIKGLVHLEDGGCSQPAGFAVFRSSISIRPETSAANIHIGRPLPPRVTRSRDLQVVRL